MENKYQQWMNYEMKWLGEYRRKLMRTTTYITIPVVIVFLTVFMGMLSFMDRMDPGDAFYGGLGGFLAGAAISIFFYICLRFGLREGKYRRLIQKAADGLGLDSGEKEVLAAEMLDAREDSGRCICFEISSMNSKATPARFVLTDHYACLIGSSPYAILVRLADIAEIRPDEEQKTETRRGASTRSLGFLTLYTIGFYRRDRANRGLGSKDLPDEAMGFFSQSIRDQALEMLSVQTDMVRNNVE